jgi:hypothetical protein
MRIAIVKLVEPQLSDRQTELAMTHISMPSSTPCLLRAGLSRGNIIVVPNTTVLKGSK